MNMKYGKFINYNGIKADVVDVEYTWWNLKLFPKVMYRVSLDKIKPATYQSTDHVYIRPDKTFESDLGSIPVLLQPFLPKDQFRTEYCFHDSEYAHGGVWVSPFFDGDYKFIHTTREQADDRLFNMILAGGGASIAKARTIWLGVRAGGWASWCKGDHRKTKLREIGREILK